MRYTLLIFLFLVTILGDVCAQRYTAKEGNVVFYSHATLEDIRAESKKLQSLFNAESGEVAFRMRIADFQFRKKLMQEHFNEKYMESDKYPEATFSGILSGFSADHEGKQAVRAKGNLTIHGISKPVDIPGTVELTKDGISMHSVFKVKLEDYNITIPQILWQNIAEEVEVTIQTKYKKN
jgi:polyisoprenoid-binding protein YceI